MSKVEADVDLVQMGHLENRHQMLGSGGIAGEILDQYADTQRLGEGPEMFESCRRILHGPQ